MLTSGSAFITATAPRLTFTDTDASANSKKFAIDKDGGTVYFYNLNDDNTLKNTPLTLNADGTATFGGSVSFASVEAKGTWPGVAFWDTDAAAGRKRSLLKYADGELVLIRLDDAGAIVDYPWGIYSTGHASTPSYMWAGYGIYSAGDTRTYGSCYVQKNTGGNIRMCADGGAARTGWLEWRRQDNSRVAYMGYVLDGDNAMYLQFDTSGGKFEVGGGCVRAGTGLQTKEGSSGAYGGSTVNFAWDGTNPIMYVDATNIGYIVTTGRINFRHVNGGSSGSISAGNEVSAISVTGVGSGYLRGYQITSYHYGYCGYTQIYIMGTWYTNGWV